VTASNNKGHLTAQAKRASAPLQPVPPPKRPALAEVPHSMVASRSEAPAPGAPPPAAQRRQSAPAAWALAGKQQRQHQQQAAGVWGHGSGGGVELAATAPDDDQTALLQVRGFAVVHCVRLHILLQHIGVVTLQGVCCWVPMRHHPLS
jgi:hypothetical protein